MPEVERNWTFQQVGGAIFSFPREENAEGRPIESQTRHLGKTAKTSQLKNYKLDLKTKELVGPLIAKRVVSGVVSFC